MLGDPMQSYITVVPYPSCIIVFLQVGKSNSTLFQLIANKWLFALLASCCCLPVCDQDVVSFIHSCMLTMIGWNMQTHSKAWAIYVPSSQSPFSASSQNILSSTWSQDILSAWWDGTREREARGFSTVWQVWMRMRPRGGGGVKLIKPPHALVLICSYILIWSCAHMPIYPSYPRRWRRLGINMHTFIYLATVATTSFVVFYLIFYFILSDVPA